MSLHRTSAGQTIALTRRQSEPVAAPLALPLTAEMRSRSRHRHTLPTGETVYLQLPRGTHLHPGDLLTTADGSVTVRVVAQLEPVLTVRAAPLALLRAAYHLGNRHVPLEVRETYLRLAPDPVLSALLVEQLRVEVTEEVAPFFPEAGAYHSH